MKLSARARYGLRGLVDLVRQGAWDRDGTTARPLPLARIAQRQDVDEGVLRHVFVDLRRAGLVRAAHGRNGGYSLARGPQDISTEEILRVLGDGMPAGPRDAAHERGETRTPWDEISDSISRVLSRMTLADLAQRCRACGIGGLPYGYEFQI